MGPLAPLLGKLVLCSDSAPDQLYILESFIHPVKIKHWESSLCSC